MPFCALRRRIPRSAAHRIWCRRGDSNSHGLRHCPLKTACLPISPRRPACHFGTSPDFRRRSVPVTTVGAARCPVRSRRCRRRRPAAGRRPPAPRACRRSSAPAFPSRPAASPRRCPFVRANQVRPRLERKNTAARIAVVRDRKLAEPGGAEEAARRAAAERRAHVGALAVLQQHEPADRHAATSRCTTSNNVSSMFIFVTPAARALGTRDRQKIPPHPATRRRPDRRRCPASRTAPPRCRP